MKGSPTILLTNDDGIHSRGLLMLKRRLDELGRVVVVAPEGERSGIGKALTIDSPIRVLRTRLADGSTAYAVADVKLPAETQARLWVAHDDGLKLWLNGQLILSHGSRGERHQDITLPAGRSRLLAKICNMTEWWRLSIRLTTPKGGALDGLKHGD